MLACGGTNAGARGRGRGRAAVPVPPAPVAGEEDVELGEQVVVAAGAGLDDRDARRRVRHEHVQQPAGLAAHELRALVGEVDHRGLASGPDRPQL
jgi:hypothetical protein